MNQDATYLIKDLSKRTNITPDAIRFYEKKNLIQPSFRADNNYRYYNEEALKRLILIKRCRSLDMTLKEIETIIELEKHPSQDCCAVNEVIDEHIKHVEDRIEELQKFQAQLIELRESCSSQNTIDSCQILKNLEDLSD